MVAHHWFFLIKKIKNNKNKKKTEIKNENKNVEKIKNILFRKTPIKLPWPKSAKSDKKLYSKKKKNHKITMTYECQIWYLVTRLYI